MSSPPLLHDDLVAVLHASLGSGKISEHQAGRAATAVIRFLGSCGAHIATLTGIFVARSAHPELLELLDRSDLPIRPPTQHPR